MKIYIHSCHAALEFDHAEILKKLGHEVLGQFDLGNTERPKVQGATDANRGSPRDADVVLLHQCQDFQIVLREYVYQGLPTILSVFGQGCLDQHKEVARVCQESPLAHVMAYSIKDYQTYLDLGVPEGQLRLIRFAKDLSIYRAHGGWNGRLPLCYVAGNSIQRRGDGCGWDIVQQLIALGVPIMLSGSETDVWTDWGIGRLSYEGMISMFHQARCYLAMGTIPAPYTLSLMEAMCAGTPVIAYDNGAGVVGEGLGIPLGRSMEELRDLIMTTIKMPQSAIGQHKHSVFISDQLFNQENALVEWATMLDEVTA